MEILFSDYLFTLERPTSARSKMMSNGWVDQAEIVTLDGRKTIHHVGFHQNLISKGLPKCRIYKRIFFSSLNKSGLEENCIRSRNQIRILGIAKGWTLLTPHVQAMTINTEGANTNLLSGMEMKVLGRMRREVGESK